MRDALDLLLPKLAKVLQNLQKFALQWKGESVFMVDEERALTNPYPSQPSLPLPGPISRPPSCTPSASEASRSRVRVRGTRSKLTLEQPLSGPRISW